MAWATAAALALSGCGGSGSGSGSGDAMSSSGVAAAASAAAAPTSGGGRKQALAAPLPPTPVPADAHLNGMWGPVYPWPHLPIHAVLMPDGRVMTYGSRADGTTTAFFSIDLWDSEASPDQGHVSIPNGTGSDLFCGSQLLLTPGLGGAAPSAPASVYFAGGDAWNGVRSTFVGIRGSSRFDGASGALVRGAEMNRARWYSSATTLVNGEIYIQGGSGGADVPEVRQADGTFRALTGISTDFLQWSYPRNYVMPDGRVFGHDFEGRTYFVEPAGAGAISPRNILPWQYFGFGSSAMFRPGRILQVGGMSNAAAVIDVTPGYAVFTPTQSVSSVRKLMNTTLLPDGQVLVTGGSPVWNDLAGANRSAETWDPVSGQWRIGAAQQRARLYHSSALLLPDATVLTGGGGGPAPIGIDATGERNVEIYYPPYLFAAGGVRAARPQITAAPDALQIGRTFALRAGGGTGGVSRVTLVKTGSVTHGWNMDQRFLELAFTRTANPDGTSQLAVQMPARAGEATPGYYLLFVFDGAGVPSVARTVRLGVAAPIDAAAAPTVSGPATRQSPVGTALTQAFAARDPNGDRLTWSAAGLPPGLRIDAASGVVSGTPTAGGTYDAVVAVSDGVNSATVPVVWTVNAAVPLQLVVEPVPGASLVGSAASFSAMARGVGVQVAWNFGDGSGTTPWSSAQTTTKIYSRPGTYNVTVSVRDASGATIVRTFLQTVYVGNPDPASNASTPLLVETPHYGPPRVWVVNADQDTITAFDTITHTRLGEVAVGAGPRAIASTATEATARVGGIEQLWVTNKDSATLSIVDPYARRVVRTIALPRGSQPHGVVISPVRPQAFVVLEATGELLRFDTNTYAQTGRLALGPGVRHVTIVGHGRSAYVTRFITPPLPGESTASVSTPADRGGEVIEVDAQAMAVVRTIVLAHNDRPDAENDGSGIPNYLGPAVVSPDGTQAYVPSKQDNVKRGAVRNGSALNFQNTVRAVSSRIAVMGANAGREDLARRIDHDNASVASAVAFERRGVLMFVALETSREVAVVDAHSGQQLMRIDTGLAPQGLALSPDGYTLYVHNFMDRTVGVHDLRPLLDRGLASVPVVATMRAVAAERLAPAVLRGKQLFHDARDTRLARDRYLSCASCHADGGHDGRVWDMTHAGEGLRNTIALTGRAGMAHGRLHWSANFDEVQDFEIQIRQLAGGSGLMGDTDLAAGTRSQPLGERKAGVSADLDALAAYVASLGRFAPSPARAADGTLTADAQAGRAVFAARCAGCHGGAAFTNSGDAVLPDVGTRKTTSGRRSGAALAGIDAPTLRDAWATAPYLHDGSAPTLAAAVQAHTIGPALSAADLAAVVAYVQQLGGDEAAAPAAAANLVVRARSTLLAGVGAWYEVRAGGAVVGAGQLDATGWADLTFHTDPLPAGTRVDVVFRNDASGGGEDRNFAVQSLRFNGTTAIDPIAAAVPIDFGSGPLAFDGLDLNNAAATAGWVWRNGAMRFTLAGGTSVPPPSPTGGTPATITVRARGTLAAGVAPRMTVRVAGVVVGTSTVGTTLQDFAFPVPAGINAGDRIDVVFDNDAMINGEDRNLLVDSVLARGAALRPTDAGAVIDNGSSERAFDGLNVVPAAQWGGWMPGNGAMRLTAR